MAKKSLTEEALSADSPTLFMLERAHELLQQVGAGRISLKDIREWCKAHHEVREAGVSKLVEGAYADLERRRMWNPRRQ
jgi:hypothetical protein